LGLVVKAMRLGVEISMSFSREQESGARCPILDGPILAPSNLFQERQLTRKRSVEHGLILGLVAKSVRFGR